MPQYDVSYIIYFQQAICVWLEWSFSTGSIFDLLPSKWQCWCDAYMFHGFLEWHVGMLLEKRTQYHFRLLRKTQQMSHHIGKVTNKCQSKYVTVAICLNKNRYHELNHMSIVTRRILTQTLHARHPGPVGTGCRHPSHNYGGWFYSYFHLPSF